MELSRVASTPRPTSILGTGAGAGAPLSTLSTGFGSGYGTGAPPSALWTGSVPAAFLWQVIVGPFICQVFLHSQAGLPLGAGSGAGAFRGVPSSGGVSGTGALPSAVWIDDISGAGDFNDALSAGGVSPAPFAGGSSSSVEHLLQSSALLYWKVKLQGFFFSKHKTPDS